MPTIVGAQGGKETVSEVLKQAESRLRYGIPLRLDQVTDLMQEGIDASVVEQNILNEEEEEIDPDDEEYND